MVHQHRQIAMRPSVWGPIFWHTMHIISLGYPEEPDEKTRQAASSFYQSLSLLIPCPICRTHYTQHLQQTPPTTESRKSLVEWVWKIHNKVNHDIGKAEVSFDAFLDHMESLSQGSLIQESATTQYPLLTGICIGVGVSILSYALWYRISFKQK